MSIKNLLISMCIGISLCVPTVTKSEDIYLIDQMVVTIFTPEGTEIITKSDVDRLSLEGQPRTLEQLKDDRLMSLDAKKYNMWPDAQAITDHLEKIKADNGLSDKALLNIFKQSGYTYDDARQEFAIMYANSNIVEFKIRSRLIVPEKDVIAYYENNPEFDDAAYQIERAVVPLRGTKSEERQLQEIERNIKAGTTNKYDWSVPFWLAEEDIAEDKAFIKGMKIGAISKPQKLPHGFELYRVLDKKEKRKRTLEERYREIVNILRQPKYVELFNDYKKSLFENASIVHFE